MKRQKSKIFERAQKQRNSEGISCSRNAKHFSESKGFQTCPTCKGKMEKIKDVIKQDNIEFEAFRCVACGEEIMNMKQLKNLAQKYRKLRKAKEITFAKWGNSIAVRIPKDIVSEYHITSGKQGILTKDKEGIKIIPT